MVKVNGALCNGKAKSGAACFSLAGIRYPEKRMENVVNICVRNAGAVVSYGDFGMRRGIDANFSKTNLDTG
jgi:hypothetical protein